MTSASTSRSQRCRGSERPTVTPRYWPPMPLTHSGPTVLHKPTADDSNVRRGWRADYDDDGEHTGIINGEHNNKQLQCRRKDDGHYQINVHAINDSTRPPSPDIDVHVNKPHLELPYAHQSTRSRPAVNPTVNRMVNSPFTTPHRPPPQHAFPSSLPPPWPAAVTATTCNHVALRSPSSPCR